MAAAAVLSVVLAGTARFFGRRSDYWAASSEGVAVFATTECRSGRRGLLSPTEQCVPA
jgi:hypothetical protein